MLFPIVFADGNFCGSGRKGIVRISVKKMSLTPGDDDLGSQRPLPRRKLRKRPRDPFLEA